MTLPPPGTRIDLAGNRGTVRYAGPVEHTNGVWLGVEWDDPSRGKHDGFHDGKRYFTCRVPNSGSFIRPTAHNLSYGVSFLQALLAKYIEQLHGSDSQETVMLGSSNGSIQVEAVHLDKIRQKLARVDRLRDVSLDRDRVAKADPPGNIKQKCPSIRNLDISQSLIPSWDVVAAIASELPLLQALVLNHNRFSPQFLQNGMVAAFERLEELQLNATLISWREVLGVMIYMPILRLLELGYNRLTHLETNASLDTRTSTNGFTLQSLNLDSNECSDWLGALLLHPITSLERVLLSSNGIQSIPYPSKSQAPMRGISSLFLSSNVLRIWNDVDALSHWCPALQKLTLGGNPFASQHESYYRQVTIAMLPSLVTLDGVAISLRERTDCELFYLSYIGKNGFQSPLLPEQFPRWHDLCEKHGAPTIRAPAASGGALGHRLIELQVFESSGSPLPGALSGILATKPVLIRVLPTMSLRMLRSKIAKAVKANNRKITLGMVLDGGKEVIEMSSDEDTQTLEWLGLEAGTQIVVSP